MHQKNIVTAGVPLAQASKVLIMLHGRGANAADILSLASHLQVKDYALLAPEATGHSWYPYSFMMPRQQNEPWLTSALDLLAQIVNDVKAEGLASHQIYFAGFSQGACLSLEFTSRHATKYGGIVAFTGGLIGDHLDPSIYQGSFENTPVFIGTSDPDPHVPVSRVNETVEQMRLMNADVTAQIYEGMGHTINQNEIDLANHLVFADRT